MQMQKLKPFSVSHSGIITGELFKARNIFDLIENRIPKRAKNWELIGFVDSENRNIAVTREFIDDQKMSVEEVIKDWIENGDTEQPIEALNPNRQTLTQGLTVTLSEFSFSINK